MNQLPKIFCLTLKDTPKRKEYADQHFKQNDLDVEFFDGINGEKFGLRTTIPYNDDDPDGPDYFIKQGRIGCLLSHYMLWQTLWHLPYEEILILEDDAVLCENFQEKFLEFKSQLPDDWQYVFVGHCCLPPEYYQIKVTDNIITTTHPPMCTHAYMIKKSSIPVLLETNHQAWAAVDIQIQKKSLKILKHYVFLPPLIDQMSLLKQKEPDNSIDSNNIFNSLTLDSNYLNL
jgi:GR25 family glycosyltransferase involved in LPS biosynthesis